MRSISRHLLAIAGAVAFTAASAGAQTVVYNTTGSFNGGGPVINYGTTGSLIFNGLIAQGADPGNISFGTIDANATDFTSLNGTSFVLTVTQTAPPAGSDVFNGALTGSITAFGSQAQLNFTNTSIVLGGYRYSLPGSVSIVAPSTNGGRTTIQGTLVTPEPASMTLLATGLAGVFGAARRRKNAKA